MRLVVFLWLVASVLFISSCGSEIQLSDEECISKITSITEIPFKDDLPARGTYHQILAKTGDKAITECLLSQITNTTPTFDPRASTPGPHKQLVIGDISVFMLSRMYDIPFSIFIDGDAWANMGIFSYYRYIETEDAREHIARVFREHLKSSEFSK